MSARGSYLEIKHHVLGKIRGGDWPPGTLVPKERELAEAFGCARMTVHRALRELAEEGVVERRRRSGTRVALQTTRSAMLEIPRVDHEIERQGATYRYRRLARRLVLPNDAVAGHLGLPATRQALRVDCLHFATDVPFQLEERWINLDAVPDARAESFRDTPPNVWLLERRPWFEAEHVISAAGASARHAERLNLAVGDSLLVVERRTWNDTGVITYVRMLHPGRFYRLRTSAGPAPRAPGPAGHASFGPQVPLPSTP